MPKSEKKRIKNLTKTQKFYEEQTGLYARKAPARIKNIKKFLKNNNLSLEDVKIEQHVDQDWNKRRNRNKKEKKSKSIGNTSWTIGKAGITKNKRYWIVPK